MTTVVAQTSSTSTLLCGENSPTTFSSLRSRRSIDDNDKLRHVTVDVSPISNSSRFTRRLPRSLASLALHSFRENVSDTDTDSEEETFRKRRKGGGRRGGGVEGDNFSVLALFVTALRKSVVRCYNTNNKGDHSGAVTSSVSSSSSSGSESSPSRSSSSCSPSSSWGNKMEIGVPTNVRHVAHVTFDRFNGFLGLPVEFEPEVSRRAPSASAKVFGVSTNSMQLSFDSRGNSVPTILLMMQHRLYALGGLEVEGIFRINAGNDQEEYVRDQLNHGVVPSDADVHCLAGLIKAWFRELPIGLLDSLPTEQLIESQTEDECAQLARHLPPTEASLLDWAVNLMADIVQYEHRNKMNARNVAVVFAPNMTHVMDPLTALMHAVQVMNFLKTLIVRTLREREDSILDDSPPRSTKDHQFGESSGPQTPLQTIIEEEISDGGVDEDNDNKHISNKSCLDKDKPSSSHCLHQREELSVATKTEDRTTVSENSMEKSMRPSGDPCEETDDNEVQSTRAAASSNRVATGKFCNYRKQPIMSVVDKGQRTGNRRISQPPVAAMGRARGGSNSAVNHKNPAGGEIIESWR